jgi:hypothetical protein
MLSEVDLVNLRVCAGGREGMKHSSVAGMWSAGPSTCSSALSVTLPIKGSCPRVAHTVLDAAMRGCRASKTAGLRLPTSFRCQLGSSVL